MDRDERYRLMDHIRVVEKMLHLIEHLTTSENTFDRKLVQRYVAQAIGHLDYVKRKTDPDADSKDQSK